MDNIAFWEGTPPIPIISGTELLVFDDFEDGDSLNTLWDGGWAGFAANPLVQTDWEVIDGGYDGSDKALAVQTSFPAGAWGGVVCMFNANGFAVNMSEFDGISFAMKGAPNPVHIVLRENKAESDRGWAYCKVTITPTEEWKLYNIPFDSLAPLYGDPVPPFDATDLYALDFRATTAADTVDIVVDNIAFWEGTPPSAVDNLSAGLPKVFSLHQNFPNPFNPTTSIKYELPKDVNVKIAIYDIMGRQVRSLVNMKQTAGYKTIVWDGRNNNGQLVSSGIYLYQMITDEFQKVKKMTFIK